MHMAAQNTRFCALFVHFRTRSPPKRDTNRAKTRSEPLRSFACFCHFCIRSAPKRAADRASHPFATKAHRRPRQNPIRSSALGQRLRSRSCPRGVLSISPGGGVLFPLRLKTKDERREDSAPPTLRRRLGKIHPPHPHPIVRKLELATFLPKDTRIHRFLPFQFSSFLHTF